jgi:hypothetical protein
MFSSDAIYSLDLSLNLSPALHFLLRLLLSLRGYIWDYFLSVQQHFMIYAGSAFLFGC